MVRGWWPHTQAPRAPGEGAGLEAGGVPGVLGGAVRTLEKPGAALLRALAMPSRHLSLDVLEFSGQGLWWQIVRGGACGKAWRGGSPLFSVATVHAASRARLTFATLKQLLGAYGGRGQGSSGLSAAVEWGGLH